MDELVINATMDVKGFLAGTQRLNNAIKSFGTNVDKAMRNVQGAGKSILGTIMRWGPALLGVGGAYSIISRSVSAFMAQNQQLSNTLQACWNSIGSALGPIITNLVNLIAQAVQYLMAFLKLLGVSTANSKSAGKAAGGAAQELKKQLMGFDELNVLQDNKNNGGGGGAGTLSEIEAPEWMKKFADWIKEVWSLLAQGKWDEAADMIIAGMNKLIYTFRDKAYELGDAIGKYLGGALHVIARVLDEVDWHAIGETLANFLNGIINHIDGADLGKIFVSKFTIAFKMLTGFLENLNWGKVGIIISDAIVAAVNSVEKAINNADFKRIGAGIRAFFESIDWKAIADSIFGLLKAAWNSALDMLWGLLAGDSKEEPPIITAFRELGKAIEEVAKAAKPHLESLAKKIQELGSSTLKKVIEDITQLIYNITDLLNGEKTFAQFIGDLSPADKALAGIAASLLVIKGIVAATAFTKGLATAIWSIKTLFGLGGGAAAAGGLAAAGGAAAGPAPLIGSLKDVKAAIELIIEAAGGLPVLGPILATLGIAVGSWAAVTKQEAENVEKAFDGLGDSTDDYAVAVNRLQGEIDQLKKDEQNLAECGGDLTMVQQDIGSKTNALNQVLEQMAAKLGISKDKLVELINEAGGDATKLSALTKEMGSVASETENLAAATHNLAIADENLSSAKELAKTSTQAYNQYLQVSEQLTEEQIAAQQAFDEALGRVAVSAERTAEKIRNGSFSSAEAAQTAIGLSGTLDILKEKYGTSARDMEVYKQVQEALMLIGDKYKDVLAEQGIIIDRHGKVIQTTAEAVDREAASISAATKETELNKQSADNLATASKNVATQAGNTEQAIDSLGKEVSTMGEEARKGGEEFNAGLTTGIKEGETETIQVVSDMLQNIIDTLNNGLEIHSPSKITHEAGGYFVEGFTQGVTENATSASDAVTELAENIVNTTQTVVESGVERVTQIIQSCGDRINQIIKIAAESISATIQSCGHSIDNAVQQSTNSVMNGFQMMQNTITTAMSQVNQICSQVFNNLVQLSGQAGEAIARNYAAGMTQMYTTAVNVATQLNSTFGNYFGQIAQNGYIWGKDLGILFNNGLVDACNAYLMPTLRQVAQSIKNVIGFSKPKEGPLSDADTYMPDFMRLLASGIESYEDEPLNAVANLAEGVKDELENGDYNFGDFEAGELDVAFSGFADQFLNGFGSLIDRLDAIADRVIYKMPDVATGNVLPYSVSSENAQNAIGSVSDVSEIVNAINGLRTLLTQNNGENTGFNITVLLDGEQIEAAVSTRQRRKKIAQGV